MRTGRINYKITGNVKYPDEIVFAFNPLFIELSDVVGVTSLGLKVSAADSNGDTISKEIAVSLYDGSAKIYYSRIVQLLFDNIQISRCVDVTVGIVFNSTDTIFSYTHRVLWGSLALGEKFLSGTFAYRDGKPTLERTLVWFKKFPFTVSTFGNEAGHTFPTMTGKVDRVSQTNAMFYHPLSHGSLSSISGTSVSSISSPSYVYFVTANNCFYAKDSSGNYSKVWSRSSYIGDSSLYNGSDGVARNDMFWCNSNDRDKIYRYDSQDCELVELEYGSSNPYGIFEMHPFIAFSAAIYSAEYVQGSPDGKSYSSTFDFTFDYTFFMSHQYDIAIKLLVNNDEAGHYLRWIDKFGYIQYYLFTKGEITRKNTISSDSIYESDAVRGMYFTERERPMSITSSKSHKCSAVLMPEDVYEYVSTIVTSPVVDLYLGKTKGGREIWMPVNIVASSYKYSPKENLHDLEIEFTTSDLESQSL